MNKIGVEHVNELILEAIKDGFLAFALVYAVYILAMNEYDKLDDKTKDKIKKDVDRIKSKILKSKEAVKNE